MKANSQSGVFIYILRCGAGGILSGGGFCHGAVCTRFCLRFRLDSRSRSRICRSGISGSGQNGVLHIAFRHRLRLRSSGACGAFGLRLALGQAGQIPAAALALEQVIHILGGGVRGGVDDAVVRAGGGDIAHGDVQLAAALEQLERVTEKWEKDYPNAMKSWYKNWDVISPIFKFSADVRKVIYTTNAIESLNSGYRRLNKQRSVFPSDTALLKALYLATHEIAKKWTMPLRNWGIVLGELEIMYLDRLS